MENCASKYKLFIHLWLVKQEKSLMASSRRSKVCLGNVWPYLRIFLNVRNSTREKKMFFLDRRFFP